MSTLDHARGEPREFTSADFEQLFATRRNWGRWGPDDQRGLLNLIDDAKRVAAASLVRSGRLVSMCRPFPKDVATNNPRPALHYLQRTNGVALDFYGISYHGVASTHLDALCHMWHETGMWNGHDPDDAFDTSGYTFGSVEHWAQGIVTRGVFFDIPRHRGVDCVEQDEPVQGYELERICIERGIEVTPGDAIVVHSGRDAWSESHGRQWGSGPHLGTTGRPIDPRPGLHASCLEFIRDTDCSILVWDMLDHLPEGGNVIGGNVHSSIWMFGLALVDNALLGPLAAACAEEGRDEFLFTIGPLNVKGGTGSPVNPMALF